MMRPIWIVTAILAPLSQIMAASLDSLYLAARGLGDGPGDCDTKFFEMTDKNLRESKSDEFYRDFILKTSKAHPEEYTRVGEVAFFARHAFNGLDVRCSSHIRGCTGIPTCRDILEHTKRHGGDRDMARRVYFSIKKIEFIVDAIFWFHRALAIIEGHADLVSRIIVKDFAPKRGIIAEDSCRAIKSALKAVSHITKSFEGFVSSSPYRFSVGSVFSLAMKLVEEFGDSGKDHVEARLVRKAVNGIIKLPDLEVEKKAVDELCASEIKRASALNHKESKEEDLTAQNVFLFKKQIIKATTSLRETISRILDIVVAGDAIAHPEFDYLFELMSRYDWTDEARRLYESFDEKQVTRIFEKSLITSSWHDSKCYQKCVCKEDFSSIALCNNKDLNSKYRYCPEDGSGCACQLQCLSSNVKGRKNEVQLLGLEQLQSWGIDFMEILVKSYERYRIRKDVPEINKRDDQLSAPKIHKRHCWHNGHHSSHHGSHHSSHRAPKVDIPDCELNVPEIDKPDSKLSTPEIGKHDEEQKVPEFHKHDEELSLPEIDEHEKEPSVLEIDELDDKLSTPDFEKYDEELSVPKIDKPDDKLSIPDFDKHNGEMSLPKINEAFIKSIKAEENLLELPTCASVQLDMGDFKKDGWHNRLFPCTCGDWRSNETQIFMRQLGFGKFQPGYKTKLAEEIFTRDCPGSLTRAKLKPFNHFLAFCELGIKWPHKDDVKTSGGKLKSTQKHHVHMNMIDSRCKRLKKETAGMTEAQANFHFCTISDTGKEVFADEVRYISGAGLVRPGMPIFQATDGGNHWHMCRQFFHYR